MIDREKVIKGLECCLSCQPDGLGCSRVPCPYNQFEDCEGILHRDALALLKAQEAVEPIKRENHNGFIYYHCAKCDTVLMAFHPKYCHECGQAVKWE